MEQVQARFTSIDQFESHRLSLGGDATGSKRSVIICAGTACRAKGAMEIATAMQEAFKARKADVEVRLAEEGVQDGATLRTTGCHGFCERGPLVVSYPANILYEQVKLKDVEDIVERSLFGDEVIERLCYTDPVSGKTIPEYPEIPFHKKQLRIALANLWHASTTPADQIARDHLRRELARGLTARGHTVLVVQEHVTHATVEDGEAQWVFVPPSTSCVAARRLLGARGDAFVRAPANHFLAPLRRFRPEVVHSFDLASLPTLGLLGRLCGELGARLVVHDHQAARRLGDVVAA